MAELNRRLIEAEEKNQRAIPLERIRDLVRSQSLEATFTMAAEAREFRETQAIGRMSPEERQRYYEIGVLTNSVEDDNDV